MGRKKGLNKGYKRKPKVINEPPAWLICCEGKTEVLYLKGLVRYFANGRSHRIYFGIKDVCAEDGFCGRQHCDLMNQMDRCSRNRAYEKKWFVQDMDAKGEMEKSKIKSFNDSIRMANNRDDVEVAWSIPLFEYWLALHGSDYVVSNDEKTLQKNLKILLEAKNKEGIFCTDEDKKYFKEAKCVRGKGLCIKAFCKPYCNSFKLLGGEPSLENACKHATRRYKDLKIDKNKSNFSNIDSCTNMHLLVQAIKEYFEGDYFEKL